jgi:uncharacterized protein (TIGR00290 family)
MPIKAFCFWSGGRESCLCFDRAVSEGIAISSLFSVLKRDMAGGAGRELPKWLLERQARAMRTPIMYQEAGCADGEYETKYEGQLKLFREQGYDIGIFDDIDGEERKKLAELLCAQFALKVIMPLWRLPRRRVIGEFIGLGYQAIVVRIKKGALPSSFLGRAFNDDMIADLQALGIDPYAACGVFGTFVVDGPIFRYRVRYNVDGFEEADGYTSLRLCM